jgi:hypothetical protein
MEAAVDKPCGIAPGVQDYSSVKRDRFVSYFEATPVPVGRSSELIRAGLSGDRMPVEARFSAPVQAGPGAHPPSCPGGTRSLSRG